MSHQKKIKRSPAMRCIGCGCTDAYACDGGCYWFAPGVCSKCHEISVRVTTEIARLRKLKKAPAGKRISA